MIKLEKFPAGDDARHYRREGDAGVPPSFMILNRGKRSIGIDLKSSEGRQAVLRMVGRADIVTENFRQGVMQRLGLGYDVLRDANPKLIYCSISGYGTTGPMAEQGGFDLILQAFSGLISVTGEADGPLVKPGVSIADVNAGILAAFGILAAYAHRLKTGEGMRVDTSLLQASLQQMYWHASAYFAHGVVAKPSGTSHPLIAPYQVFQCSDGGIAIGGANQTNWERITDVLGHSEWITDPRFEAADSRVKYRRVLEGLINTELTRGTVAYWIEQFERARVPVGPVQDVGEALEHEQSLAVGMVREVNAPGGGKTRALGLPVLFDGKSHVASSAAPRVGEHSESVLSEFGFAPGEIAELLATKAIFQAL